MSSTYLVDPGMFPARAEGTPWGGESATLTVAGAEILVVGLSRIQRATLSEIFQSGGPTTWSTPVSVFRVDASAFREFDRRGWSYSLDFDYGPRHTHIVGMDWMARIEWSDDALESALWLSTEEPGSFHGALENFLRVHMAHAMVLRGGLLVHSAAVLSAAGAAHLFVGPSGAGKSTVARLAQSTGRRVVSDDLNLIAPDFTLAASPFRSEIGSRESGFHPLRGIYRLVKGTEDTLHPMGEGEALASLVACAPFVNQSRFLANRLWSNLEALSRNAPTSVLTFRREGTFWPLLEKC
ncbi:MAG: hypothetical protein ACRD21_16450 [Vicinamibacteria bacterium]